MSRKQQPLRDEQAFFIGIDVGGTKLRIGAARFSSADAPELAAPCQVLSSDCLAEDADPAEAFVEIIRTWLHENDLAEENLKAIGIGVPATVEKDFSTICEVPNIPNPKLQHFPLGKALTSLMGVPVYVDKDVNLLLRYDARVMKLKGTVLAIYIGTGIGTAVSLDGQILYGAHGFAMDAGHMPMKGEVGMCGCGKRGCAETISAGHVLRSTRENFFPGTPMETLFIAHRDSEVLRNYVRNCAYVPATLATVFDPDVVILGGGVIEMAGFPRAELEEEIRTLTGRAVTGAGLRFRYSERNESRGVLGAAELVREQLAVRGRRSR